MTLSHLYQKIKSQISSGSSSHTKFLANQQFKQNSDNLASFTSKLRSYLPLLPFIYPFVCLSHSSQFQTAGGY